jgi:hypothetical protein
MDSAMEFAFASTSEDADVAEEFAEKGATTGGAGVLLKVKCCQKDAIGFHSGVDLAWISAVKTEKEVLFPPFTLFRVLSMRREGQKITLEVCPTWVFV